jgi:hypothetical protein
LKKVNASVQPPKLWKHEVKRLSGKHNEACFTCDKYFTKIKLAEGLLMEIIT